MSDDRLNEITDRLLSIGCSVSSHDSYQEWFCSECGHDAKAEILAALLEAAATARQEERDALEAIIVDVREHETAVCSSVNTWRFCCDEMLDRLAA